MNLKIWKGYHGPELLQQIADAWEGKYTLALGAPGVRESCFQTLNEKTWEGRSKPVLAVLTSGTTASPRTIYYSRENIEASLNGIMELFDQDRIDTVFCYPQPFHVFGLTLGYVLSLLKGWKLVASPGKYSREAHVLRESLQSEKVLTLGTPVHFRDLKTFLAGRSLKPSYTAVVGGAPITLELWQTLRSDLNIEAPSVGYGCSEASPGLTHLPPGMVPLADGAIGFLLKGVQVENVPGQGLEFSGPNACLAIEHEGKVNFPEKILVRDDIETLSDGSWKFKGRLDLVVNCGGQKLSLEGIEKAILEQVGVESLCLGLSDDRLGEDLGIILKSNDSQITSRVGELLATQFQKRLNPHHVMLVEQFPVNVNGKFDRQQGARWVEVGRPISFPINTSDLQEWIPHRPPMIWVDQVMSVDAHGGECSVLIRENGLYLSQNKMRLPSLIEFVAQSYAFVRCAQALAGHAPKTGKVAKAFLVGSRDAEFSVNESDPRLAPGKKLLVKVSDVRQVGPFVIYTGTVLDEAGATLMKTTMKLYHEEAAT